ncbi:hypothetical protein O181_011492 [Austropuccinia psidii MF-1]|uniref:DDE Tnp4 domain-containing protein n=1 Tax=Austropuccinia psidii MF-1 TaxID=1389203 RepID=A0A9Q3GM52_9BASI|nr:hypothetical protein [Austropuccinia psidii MF-1]
MVYKEMGLFKNPHLFFDKGQYLLADWVYPLTEMLMPSFKVPTSNTQINTEFNFCLARSHIQNEHVVGILKGRWVSLREMRLRSNDKDDITSYVDWIKACCILHNMLSHIRDLWDDLSEEEKDRLPVQLAIDKPTPTAAEFCNQVKNRCVFHNYSIGTLPVS